MTGIASAYYADDVDYGWPIVCEECNEEATCDCACCGHSDGTHFCEACCAKNGPCSGCQKAVA